MKHKFIMLVFLISATQCQYYAVDDYCKIEEYYMLDGIELRKCYQ